MSGSIKLPHACPKCGKVARNQEELLEFFGKNRTVPNKANPRSITNQSYCISCRSSYKK